MSREILRRLTFKQFLLYTFGIIAIVVFLGYGIFEARRIIEGPRITIASPINGSAVGGPLVTISGTIQNAAFFTINDRQVLSDDRGNFSESFSPPPGLAIIEVAARDRFGRMMTKELQINVLAQCII